MLLSISLTLLHAAALLAHAVEFHVPPSAPATAPALDSALLSLSFEFFTFPDYMNLKATAGCLSLLQTFRGAPPAVRIGGTTQDRATYDPDDTNAVTYAVPNPTDAPDSLTYGPQFFQLAAKLPGNVTLGLNRQLNNLSNTISASLKAQVTMENLFAIELGNEPEFYNSSSPIIPKGMSWSPSADAASQNSWLTQSGPLLDPGQIFQAAVYLQEPTWGTAELIPKLGTGTQFIKTFSGHSYPQSACGGAATNLTELMDHPSIISYTSRYASEAVAAHSVQKHYYLGETNSATCGGGGISPTFGAALWIIDYSVQAALQGVERLYFHQGTIADCPYCWWNSTNVNAPFYGAAFLAEAIGTNGHRVSQLDDGSNTTAVYVFFDPSGDPVRLLVVNTQYFNGTGSRTSDSVVFTGVSMLSVVRIKRLTAASALSQTALGEKVTLGGRTIDSTCELDGLGVSESVSVVKGSFTIQVHASEAVFIQI